MPMMEMIALIALKNLVGAFYVAIYYVVRFVVEKILILILKIL